MDDDQYRYLDWLIPKKPRSIYRLINEVLYPVTPRARANTPAARKEHIAQLLLKGVTPTLQKQFIVKSGGRYHDVYRLTGCASSTAVDLDGDRFTRSALARMEKEIVGVPLLEDHTYKLASVIGEISEAHLAAAAKGETDLIVTLELAFGHQPAERVWRLAEQGINIGLSVGVLVHSSERPPELRGGILIKDAEILECSVVTIPAQQRSRRLHPIEPGYTPME